MEGLVSTIFSFSYPGLLYAHYGFER